MEEANDKLITYIKAISATSYTLYDINNQVKILRHERTGTSLYQKLHDIDGRKECKKWLSREKQRARTGQQ